MKNICYESTKKCNLKCEYCITSDNKHNPPVVKYSDIIKFISKIKPERIVLSGGEPLLDNSLIDKLSLMKKLCCDSHISLSTNGTIEYDLNKVKKYINCMAIHTNKLGREKLRFTQIQRENLLPK